MRSVSEIIADSINTKNKILENKNLIERIDLSIQKITFALKNGKKILFCGNGGSAADAQHLTAEFTGRFYLERQPLPAICLNTNVSAITAIANDYSFDDVFSRQTKALGQQGDILFGITTSGNSQNIINAFEYAKTQNITTIALTGETGGKIKDYCDILINVPSKDTPRIQEAHITIGHIICELTEKELA
ncbi:MAG: D-sedoheptulose 7-phosphate isomerase [Candidatus Gastranaerophilales bacterium]|nr:D-sedoheptulose 7-phosphate isomerase [Candidatus Gastranaerophilales bacterium]